MPATVVTGALQGLKRLKAADSDRFRAAVEAGQQVGWAYYFPYLLAKQRPRHERVYLGEDDGSLCVYDWKAGGGRPRLDLLFPPMPFDAAVLRRAVERANDFNGDRTARVLRIDEKDAESVATWRRLKMRHRRSQFMYEPQAYVALTGRQLYTVRRNVSRVEGLGGLEVAAFEPGHRPACLELLERWSQEHRAAHGTSGGVGLSRRVIALAGSLPEQDLRGQVVLLDGRLMAFAFGGQIRAGLGSSFERKCATEVSGLSYFQLRSLLLTLQDCPLVNDGSDAKRAGLRQLKQSFRPVAMHQEFAAVQRGRGR